MRTLKMQTLYPWRWPSGFEFGHTARIRGKAWTEGSITDLAEPEHECDEPLVGITTADGDKVWGTIAAVECKGIDYEREDPAPAPRKRREAACRSA